LIDLQRLEELDKIGFLLSREIEFEQCVIVIDHVEKRRCAAVVKIRLMLPDSTQGRRSILSGGTSRRVFRLGSDRGGVMKNGHRRIGSARHIGISWRAVNTRARSRAP